MVMHYDKKLPQEYVENYVFTYVGYVKYNKYKNSYNGGCPFCNEGSSWGKKARFYYLADQDRVSCFNCGYSGGTIQFIKDVSGLSFGEIIRESQDFDLIPIDLKYKLKGMDFNLKRNTDTLPKNSINLCDKEQVLYYKDNNIVRLALSFIQKRRLLSGVNSPKSLYLSLDDFTHANRLVIPYYNESGKIIFYQTRKLLDDDTPKYLSKGDSDKSLYGVHNIDVNIPYIFVFEGAIDAFFVKNAVCVSGIQEKSKILFTELQKEQIRTYPFHEVIWVLDSPYLDNAASLKTQILLDQGQKVFNWPYKIGKKYKDINEICVDRGINEIPYNFFVKNLIDNKLLSIVKSNLLM